jgi:glucose-1-phosphate thymidylyltransferase
MVISPEKTDLVEHFGASWRGARIVYAIQSEPVGLCDAIFQALPLIASDEMVVVGLPDTVWLPDSGLRCLPTGVLSFLLFPVDDPRHFDAVVVDARDRVETIEVKSPSPRTSWVWGAFALPCSTLAELHHLWIEDDRGDEYFGTLVNAWIARGGTAYGIKAGERYVDVGTVQGYRAAIALLQGNDAPLGAYHRAEQESGPLPVSMEVHR